MKKAIALMFMAVLAVNADNEVDMRGQVGPTVGADQTRSQVRIGRDASVVTQDSHGRYQEAVIRGNVFTLATIGITMAAANNSPLAAGTGQPLVGIFNPANSGKNAVILRATVAYVSGTVAANGLCAWNVIASPAGITAASGTQPINNLTFQAGGSQMRGYVNQALTGGSIATLLRVIGGPTGAFASSATAGLLGTFMEETAGDVVVPPGGFAGIACGNAAGTTWIQGASMTYEEVPL